MDVKKLKVLREEQALSLRELAAASGIAHTTIWKHEQGQEDAHPRTVRLLARALDVTPRELMAKKAQDA
jgi:transcriptional regulator with XRE-family HTH domain